MSFLKEFKEDLSLAVSELLPQDLSEEEDWLKEETEQTLLKVAEESEKKAEAKAEAKKPEEKADVKSEIKIPEEKADRKPEGKTDAKPEVKMPEEKAGVKPEVKIPEVKMPEEKAEVKPEVKMPEEKTEVKPEVKMPEEKTEVKPEAKKPDEKPMEKKESKEAGKPEKPKTAQAFVGIPKNQAEAKKPEEKLPESKAFEAKASEPKEAEAAIPDFMPVEPENETKKPETAEQDFTLEMELKNDTIETGEEKNMDAFEGFEVMKEEEKEQKKSNGEVATITSGTRINGDIESDGSLEILGTINGNVTCNGKLTITGTITGNSRADEVYADSAKVEGEINTEGAVKIGLGSVILGNVNATSAVIAGAIKGDIDVHGPVIVDASAVVMGNIKSRSVQINNGAVIEGFCSQCYSDISVKSFFDDKDAGNKAAVKAADNKKK